MRLSKVQELRAMIEKAAISLDDKDASMSAELFPHMKYNGTLIAYRTRINWNGTVKMAAQDLWDTETNNPDNAPTLWTDIAYREGIRIIPEVISAADAFSAGERGWWDSTVYVSKINNNVWTPVQYPQGWEVDH